MEIYQRTYVGPISDKVHLLVVQPTPFCNIQCDYCYLPDRHSTLRLGRLTFKTLLQRIISAGLLDETLSIVWHAGEPLALPTAYYRDLFSVIAELGIATSRIRHSMQTNGILLSNEWCDFISEFSINIGVSIDGPEYIHDLHRKDRAGRGTHKGALKGIRLLQGRDIDVHAIAVITVDSLDAADDIFDFFITIGLSRIGFNVEELEGMHNHSSLNSRNIEDRVRTFWNRLYDLQESNGRPLKIREFDRAEGHILYGPLLVSPELAMVHNSQVAPRAILSCDHSGNLSSFSPELLGTKSLKYGALNFSNVFEVDCLDFCERTIFNRVATDIYRGVTSCYTSCPYFSFCGGGAPGNKYFETGSFASAETMYCRTSIQMPFDVILSGFENKLRIIKR